MKFMTTKLSFMRVGVTTVVKGGVPSGRLVKGGRRVYATVVADPIGWSRNGQVYHGPSPSSSFSTHRTQANQVDQEVLKKYKEKLAKKAEREGKETIEELLEAHLNKNNQTSKPTNQQDTIQPQPTHSPKVTHDPTQATLSSIMKVDKLLSETPETIAQVWNTYHLDKTCLSAVVPGETYRTLLKKFREFPQFLIPLPRGDAGHEFYFMQSHFHQIYFTSLGEYKTHGSQARPHLILSHYPELLNTKNVVLMRGELGSTDGAQVPLTLDEAKLLVLRLQQFYITGSPAKLALVSIFNKNPTEFDHRALLEEADKLD